MQHGKLSIEDIRTAAASPTQYLLEDFIPARSLGILVGEWGLGKSPFSLQMQLSMTAGERFLGRWQTPRPLRCLYVDMENGPHAVRGIIDTQLKFMGLKDPAGFEFYSPNFVEHQDGQQNIPEYHYIKALIKADPVDFVIIDPLRMFQPTAESKNSEAALMIKQMRELVAEAGSTVMFIHHPRKISGDPTVERYHLDTNPTEWMSNACGAASLIQNTDFRIGLEENEEGYIVMRRFIRSRGWFPPEYVGRVFDDETDEPVGYVLENGIDKLKPLERNWLNSVPDMFTTRQLKETCQKHDQIVSRLLKKYSSQGVIVKQGRGLWKKVT